MAPPANTVIGNQASATYTDTSGNPQLATSNMVQTTVQQVGAFNLDTYTTVTTNVVNTKTAAAGTTVYAPHVLTNTGNGSDSFDIKVTTPDTSFTTVQVFADANADGVPDSTTPLCTATPTATCTVPAQTVAGNNGTFSFVVAYTLPATATTPTDPYSYGTVTATVDASSPVLSSYTSPSAADRDNVNLTTKAAFNVTKAIGVPAVAAPGGGTWPTPTTSGAASTSTSCPTTWTAGMASSATCQYTVYTLTVTNTGGAAGALALQDTLPAGLTYVTGSAVWSSASGTALGDASGTGNDPTGIDYQASGNVITAVITSMPVNVSQTISFVVLVNNTAAVGTSTTTNTAKYDPTDATPSGSTTPPSSTDPSISGLTTSPTNPAPYTVTGTYGLAIGTNLPTVATATTAKDGTAGNGDGSADTTTVASVVPGGSASFPNIVFNTGNTTDTIDLAVSTNNFPTGTTFSFFKADGVTPLLDTNGDGVPDTGPISAGQSVAIVVRANVPASAIVTTPTTPYTALVVGTSTGDPTAKDGTKELLDAIVGSLVDLTNTAAGTGSGTVDNGDLGPGPSPNPTTTNTTQAGVGTIFNLFVKNNDTVANTYNLAASQSASFPGNLPTGWTVKFVAAGGTCASAAITNTGSVAAGAQVQVEACVTPPATQTAVTAQKIYFQAQSAAAASTGAIVSDVKTDAVTVTAAQTLSATLTPNNNGQVAPGGTVVYAHTLTNTGNQSCTGPYTVSASLPAADTAAGWTTALYIDVNGNGVIDDGDTLLANGQIPGPLAAGATQKLLVKVFAPGGAVAGAADTATVTVTFPSGSCGAPTSTDVSTVITGQVRVVKAQALDADCDGTPDAAFSANQLTVKPGQCVIYQVVATNEGTAPVTNLTINDVAPAYTTLSVQQPATQCASTGITPALNYVVNGQNVSCGSGTTANTVNPSGSATLTFAVKVNN